MTRKANLELINSTQIECLSQFSEPRTYQTETEIIYEGHVPHAGFLLVEGSISFYRNKKLISKLESGSLFGIAELMAHTPFPYTAVITPGSKVAILDRSTVLELKNKAKELSQLPEVITSY